MPPVLKGFIAGCLLLLTAPAEPCRLPRAVMSRFDRELGSRYAYSMKVQPCYLTADFDGDGTMDTVVLIKERKTGKSGIAILNSSGREWRILGAGRTFNGQDNLDWMDRWSIYPRGPVEEGVQAGPPPKLKGTAILAEKSESASGLIYWTGQKYAWYQQGD